MANYHILSGTADGNSYSIAVHVAVPNINNIAGVNYRTALQQSRQDPETGLWPKSAVRWISVAEQLQLDNGEIIEEVVTYQTHPGQSLVEKRDALDAFYTAQIPLIQAKWRNILELWGFDRNVP